MKVVERNDLPLPLLSCEKWMLVKENQARKKTIIDLITSKIFGI